MPRSIRVKSESLYYHVIIKGNNGQLIFERDSDYEFFLKTLEKVKKEMQFLIIAYCLMDNHVHLLLRDINESLPEIMKKIEVTYSLYFNREYERRGHLFQDRYRSSPIMDERQLFTVFRYILNNPVKAGISSAKDYKWGCYCEYCTSQEKRHVVDRDVGIELFGGVDGIKRVIGADAQDDFNDLDIMNSMGTKRIFDSEAIAFMHEKYGENILSKIQGMNKTDRNKVIKEMKMRGLSVRQISRLTGISKSVIHRV